MPGAAESAPTRNFAGWGGIKPGFPDSPDLMSLRLGCRGAPWLLWLPLNARWGRSLKVQRLLVGLGNDAHGREFSRCVRNAKALHVVGSATVIDCLDVGVADAITTHKITRSLCLRAGPALLVVRNEHLDKFRAQLRELGWGVVA